MRVDESLVSLSMSPSAFVGESVIIRGRGEVSFGAFVVVEEHVFIDLGASGTGSLIVSDRGKLKYGSVYRCYNGRITIGHHTTIGEYTVIQGHGGVEIGKDVGIAAHCSIASSNHIFEDSTVPMRYQGETALGVTIEDAVWLGTGTRILDGVKVGSSAVVGAGSVVTKSLPAEYLCLGVPCRPVRPAHPTTNQREE